MSSFDVHLLITILCFVTCAVLRLVYVLIRLRNTPISIQSPFRTIVVLGSGGHTAEILQLINKIDRKRYRPLLYVHAQGDGNSAVRAIQFESQLLGHGDDVPADSETLRATIATIPRSRAVGQSWLTTPFSTLKSCLASFWLVLRFRPQLVICNGPGTCVPIWLSAFLLNLLGLGHCRLVFVESFCRVDSLSLTGKLLYPFASTFIVLWPQLLLKYPRAQYIGQIV